MKAWQSIGLFVCLLVPALASAGVIVTIDETSSRELLAIVSTSNFDPNSLSIQNLLEQTDIHGEYFSNSPLQPGVAVAVNFHFIEPAFEPLPGSISDTLNVTITGHTPTVLDPNNISIDLHFRSDSELGQPLPPLSNAFQIIETGNLQNLTSFVVASGGPSDFTLIAGSDVPEPYPWTLMLIGATGIVVGKLRSLR